MNSFIIAYKACNEIKDNNIDLYVNFFKRNKDIYLKQKIFIDLGIKLKNVENIQNIIIFLPFKCPKENIVDLFRVVTDDEFLMVLYNSKIESKICDNNFCALELSKNRKEFYIRLLKYMTVDFCSKINECNITKITIDLNLMIDDIKKSKLASYFDYNLNFRLRLKTKEVKGFIKKSDNNKLIGIISPSEYTITQFIDFRFNYLRSIDLDLISHLNLNNLRLVNFNKIRFSTIEPVDCEISSLNNIHFKARVLESDIWNSYVENDKQYVDNMISYAWNVYQKKMEKIQITYRRSCRKISIISMSVYFFYLVFISIIASYLSWLITKI